MPVVNLAGTAMERLVHAIPRIEAQTSRPVVLIGGLAVVCRLGRPHRATADLDTVDRRRDDERSQLELLLDAGATPRGPAGALLDTLAGVVEVDVLGVTDAAIRELPDDATGRLHVMAHNWAAATASPMSLQTPGFAPITVRVAEPGPLIAMKLQSLMDRGAAKEASDLLDIVRLALDPIAGAAARQQLSAADLQLRADCLLHVELWLITHAKRSLRRIRSIPEGHAVALDDIELTAELLVASAQP
ncbi:nucleotidyl transferase AbiEii/AbiGii toxin family protein [Mycobacterium sp. MBM]|nr:nucleotidyl transferase AbiEii/AbiGii toxin family protein [Mycobacterium sp. MBM]